MKASQLRDLTRKYASGSMNREAYLAERKRLIDAVTSGEEKLRYRELDPPSSPPARSGASGSRAKYAVAGLILVLAIAFAAHFLSNNGDQAPAKPAAAQQDLPPPNPVIEDLKEFNAGDDWSDASLDALAASWAEASDSDREAARSSLPYRRLKREVETRIREHEALVAAGGDPDSLLRAARLRMFSEQLGFAD